MRTIAAGCVTHRGIGWGFTSFIVLKSSYFQSNIPRCWMLSMVLFLRCLSRVLVYFVSSVFSTTRISTRSRSYQKFELRSKDLVDPPPR